VNDSTEEIAVPEIRENTPNLGGEIWKLDFGILGYWPGLKILFFQKIGFF